MQDDIKTMDDHSLDDTLLAGHMCISKELLSFLSADRKKYVGSDKGGPCLIKVRNPFSGLLCHSLTEAIVLILS